MMNTTRCIYYLSLCFTLQTDNVYMSGVTGTINGRIFLCGRDGCVYEMDYQVERDVILHVLTS